jgi:hypothetical protein
MNRPLLTRIEEGYLKLFRIAILVVLTLVLVATVAIGVQGALKTMAQPKAIEPAKTAPAPAVSVEEFLKEFDKQPEAEAEAPAGPADAAPAQPDTTLDDKVSAQIARLYGYFDGYQRACRIADDARVDQRTFEASFNRRVMRGLLEELGDPYFQSQDGFEKALLAHPRVIEICVQRQGRHLEQWRAKIKEGEEFEDAELERVEAETAAEAERVIAEKAAGKAQLMVAAGLFGVFISLALLLIFAKIESNLRGVRVIERSPAQE